MKSLTVLNLGFHYDFALNPREDFTMFYRFYNSGLQRIFCDRNF